MMRRLIRSVVSAPLAAGIVLGATATAATLGGSAYFSDVQPGAYYDDAIGEMYRAHVITGYADGRFGPNDYVTRGQIAVMFQRFRDSLGKIETQSTSSSSTSSSSSSSSSKSSSSSSSSSSKSSSSSSVSIGTAGAIRFTSTTFTVMEQQSTATISIVRTNGNAGTVTVDYAVTAGTATAGTDFSTVTGTLTFANKETSKTFTIPILDDTTTEGTETVTLTLSNPTNGVVLTNPSTATLNITDNESISSTSSTPGVSFSSSSVPTAGAIGFGATAYAADERAGSVAITVVRTGGTAGSVSVNYATSNGSAGAGDYTATSGTLTFASGETSKSFTIAVLDDAVLEGNKTVNLTLTSPTGGSILGTNATSILTIYDTDATVFGSGSFKFTATKYFASEKDGRAIISISRVGGAAGTATVMYSTLGGSATSGLDYIESSSTMTFAPGEMTKTFTIPIAIDDQSEGEETVNLNLSNPQKADMTTPSSATLYITG